MFNEGRKVFKIGLLSLLIVALLMPTSVFVNASAVSESDEIVDTAIKYLSSDEDGAPIFNEKQAVEDGVSDEVLEVASGAYQIMCEYYRYETTGIQSRMPVYGHWCGPNYGSGTPIDLLDTGCKKHDQCYGSRGYHKCSCDNEFLSYINKNLSKMSGPQRTAAYAMKAWLKIKTSNVTPNGGNTSCRK